MIPPSCQDGKELGNSTAKPALIGSPDHPIIKTIQLRDDDSTSGRRFNFGTTIQLRDGDASTPGRLSLPPRHRSLEAEWVRSALRGAVRRLDWSLRFGHFDSSVPTRHHRILTDLD